MTGRIMDWFSRIGNWRFNRSARQQEIFVRFDPHEEHLARALGRFEPFVIKVQKVLLWENPMFSLFCLLAVNILFWLAINFECRFYGAMFSALLCGFVYDVWIQRIWPEISISPPERREAEDWTTRYPRVLSVSEISHYLTLAYAMLKDYYIWLKTLRDAQPGLFCCGMCLCFAVLTIIGRTVPGLIIGYCLIMLVMIGPGIWIHLLHPPSMMQHVWNIHAALHRGQDTDSEVEDYLPEQSGENLALLQLAGDANEEEQHDESLIIAEEFGLESADVNTMLALDEGSTDGLDISEFDLPTAPSLHSSINNNNHCTNYHHSSRLDPEGSDTDEDDGVGSEEQIRFQNMHFNGDSSEEEELAFAQGLAFTETASAPVQTTPAASVAGLSEILASTAIQAVTKNIASLGAMSQSLISTVMSGGSSQVPMKESRRQDVSRDDSSSAESEDFEMISRDDLS